MSEDIVKVVSRKLFKVKGSSHYKLMIFALSEALHYKCHLFPTDNYHFHSIFYNLIMLFIRLFVS